MFYSSLKSTVTEILGINGMFATTNITKSPKSLHIKFVRQHLSPQTFCNIAGNFWSHLPEVEYSGSRVKMSVIICVDSLVWFWDDRCLFVLLMTSTYLYMYLCISFNVDSLVCTWLYLTLISDSLYRTTDFMEKDMCTDILYLCKESVYRKTRAWCVNRD